MFASFIPLLVSVFGFAAKVISLIDKSSDNITKNKEDHVIVNIPPVNLLNKEYLQTVINQTNEHFIKLLKESENRIIEEIQSRDIRNAIQQVQAHTQSLKYLLNITNTDFETLQKIVITALNPLQVSLEVAKLKLSEYDKIEYWNYCYMLGGSALLAGYTFLGLEMPALREELEKEIKYIQLKILRETALIILSEHEDFPWERVPILLSFEGSEELSELYLNALPKKQNKDKTANNSKTKESFCSACGKNNAYFDIYDNIYCPNCKKVIGQKSAL